MIQPDRAGSGLGMTPADEPKGVAPGESFGREAGDAARPLQSADDRPGRRPSRNSGATGTRPTPPGLTRQGVRVGVRVHGAQASIPSWIAC